MKVAIATEGAYVSPHFGHCQGFTTYEINDSGIDTQTFIPNPGHRPGFLPVFLKDQGITLIIAGGMGGSAQQLFDEIGIKVLVGAQGTCDDVIGRYLQGTLQSSESVCHEHLHEGSCTQ